MSNNKKILITGASRGIGKAIALRLAAEGVVLGIHYHQQKNEAENLKFLLEEKGAKVFLFQADIGSVQDILTLGNEAWKQMSGIDVLINNAGVSYKKHFLDHTAEDIDFFFNINLKGTLLLTQGIAKNMVAEKVAGSIYTITSVNAIQPGYGLSVYGASKGGLETLMRGVALELAPHGIRVNTIICGAIQTDMNKGVWNDAEKLKAVSDHIPLGRMGEPEEIANLLAGLLQGDSYITGAAIRADGGWLLNSGWQDPEPYATD